MYETGVDTVTVKNAMGLQGAETWRVTACWVPVFGG